MKTKFVLPLILVTSAFATTTSAGNWFHNPQQNINRNIGSAPTHTPADIREMRLPMVTQAETPKHGYTVIEPAQAGTKQASNTVQPSPAQGSGPVPAASPSR